MLAQDCVLFNDTLEHNILYGRLTASDTDMIDASAAASLDTHIQERFERKYQTVVGERGLRLSGK